MLDGGHVSHDVQMENYHNHILIYSFRLHSLSKLNKSTRSSEYILSIFIISIGKPSIVASEIIMPLTVNEYFGGNVKSIAFQTKTLPATVGVMVPGEYTFDTSKKEVVTVVSGCLTVQLPDTEEWNEYRPHSSFEVAANKSFNLKVTEDTAYLCTYE